MNDFFRQVYEVVRNIPPGRVSTYGDIARAAGSPQSSRMVGWALNKSFTQKEYIPAHRVVNRFGMLSGKHYFEDETEMQKRLEAEGIPVKEDKIVDFEKYFWNPFRPD